ncbi:MAG TPA: hypothetical protein VJI97_04830 [Candidatus Nanoarchaeia archaeon]|nr:hypothetical protein [Candidatus Nanoarchaeia archaeon]
MKNLQAAFRNTSKVSITLDGKILTFEEASQIPIKELTKSTTVLRGSRLTYIEKDLNGKPYVTFKWRGSTPREATHTPDQPATMLLQAAYEYTFFSQAHIGHD